MDTAANNINMLRNRLHEYIERADERHLAAIYVLVEGHEEAAVRNYDASSIEKLHNRRDAYLKGDSGSYTVDESLALIRAGRK